jgi:hypothetical protein
MVPRTEDDVVFGEGVPRPPRLEPDVVHLALLERETRSRVDENTETVVARSSVRVHDRRRALPVVERVDLPPERFYNARHGAGVSHSMMMTSGSFESNTRRCTRYV